MKYKIFAGTCLVLVLIFAVTAFFFRGQKAKMYNSMAQNNVSAFVRDYSPVLGNDDAKVSLVEYMDPACETCAAFSPFIKQMLKASDGRLKLVIRYAPFHDGADYFIKILEAARKQGKYWETLDAMFASQSHWASHHDPQPQKVWQFLGNIGLDLDKVRQDMNDPAIEELIAQDLADAKALNVRKTPGFFVNGKPLVHFGREQLYKLIEAELKAQY